MRTMSRILWGHLRDLWSFSPDAYVLNVSMREIMADLSYGRGK